MYILFIYTKARHSSHSAKKRSEIFFLQFARKKDFYHLKILITRTRSNESQKNVWEKKREKLEIFERENN